MVGYAYSVGDNSNYNTVIIEAYNSDALDFVNPSDPCMIYRINKFSNKVDFPSVSYENFEILTLKNIEHIMNDTVIAERKNEYPSKISWDITPNGYINVKSVSDIDSVWPFEYFMYSMSEPYVNITDICFEYIPSYLEASFVCEVMNEALHIVGMYSADMLELCGNNIYCYADAALAEKYILGSDVLYKKIVSEYTDYKLPEPYLKLKNILFSISQCKFESYDYGITPQDKIHKIKLTAVSDVISVVASSVKSQQSFAHMISRLKVVFDDNISNLALLKNDFARMSGCRASDMKYLRFGELFAAFSFADVMLDIKSKVRLNQKRKHYLKNIKAPKVFWIGM